MKKLLNFVFDKKGQDVMAPQFVPSHAVAMRSYMTLSNRAGADDKPIFFDYPEDFDLVTFEATIEPGKPFNFKPHKVTPFTDFIIKPDKEVSISSRFSTSPPEEEGDEDVE